MSKYVLLLSGRMAVFGFDLFQRFYGCYIGSVFCFRTGGVCEIFGEAVVFRRWRFLGYMSAVCCFDFGCGCFIGCDTVSHLCRINILPFTVYWLDVYRNIGAFR